MSSVASNEPFVFSPSAMPEGSPVASGADLLVNEARREIVDIVREVAAAVHGDQSEDEFLGMLVDRILRAMAAEGVLVWRRDGKTPVTTREPMPLSCVRRIGRITDHSAPPPFNGHASPLVGGCLW